MNTTHRFLYGILSSLMFAVGLERLGARLDPLSQTIKVAAEPSLAAADTGGTQCWAEFLPAADTGGTQCWAETEK